MSGVTSSTPRIPRPGTPPKKPDRMAGDRMQTEGTGDNRGQVTRPDEQQGFFGSSDVERRRPPRFGTRENPVDDTRGGPTLIRQEQIDRIRDSREKRIADKQTRVPPVSADPVRERPRDEIEREEQEQPRRDRPFGRRGRPPAPPRDPKRDRIRRPPFFFGPRGPFGGRGGRRSTPPRPPFPPRPTPDRGRPTPDRGRPPFGGGRPTPPRPTPDRGRPPMPPGGFRPDRERPPFINRRPNPSKQPPDPNFEGPLPGRRPIRR